MKPIALRSAVITVVILLFSTACGSSHTDDRSATDTADRRRLPIIVDYSPTLSDVPALLYLATHPDLDLLAVTLPGTGESHCEPGVRHTRALLAVAGRPDVAVGCGRDTPLAGDHEWPAAWRQASDRLTGVVLPGVSDTPPIDAEELLIETLRDSPEPVRIVTLAPLTNVGAVLRSDPSLVDSIESIVIMGGAFDVAGNVDTAPLAEWNIHIDPEAARGVLESGAAITFVGLDATNVVPGNPALYARLAATATTPGGEAVRQLWEAHFDAVTSDGWFMWDELAAVVATDPPIASYRDVTLSIMDDGATIHAEEGFTARIATTADPTEFERLFLEVFAGGVLAPIEPLTDAESHYLDEVAGSLAAFESQLDRTFEGLEADSESAEAEVLVTRFIDGIFIGLQALVIDLSTLEPPGAFEMGHLLLVDTAATVADGEMALRALVRDSAESPAGDDFWGLFSAATEQAGMDQLFDAFSGACKEFELAALARGADTRDMCASL